MSFTPQSVFDEYEDRLEQLRSVNGSLAADLLEERAQRREVGEALVRVTEERDGLQKQLEAMDQRRLQEIETLRVHGLAVSQKLREERDEARTERDNLAVDMARLTQLMEATDRTDEARRVRLSEARAERDEARDEVVRLGRELTEALRERDLAIAHDTQPYPTADAYERACAALHRANAELVRLRTIIVELGAGEAAEPEEQIEALRPEGCPAHGVHPHNGRHCLDCPDCLSSRSGP